MRAVEINQRVLKMSIGKTEKDERTDNSGLVTKLSFDVVGHPKNLARLANVLKQPNVEVNLIVRATNMPTDMEVTSIELDHQLSLDATMKKLVQDEEEAVDVLKAGSTPVRTGDPIVPGKDVEDTRPVLCATCDKYETCDFPISRQGGVRDCDGYVLKKADEVVEERAVKANACCNCGYILSKGELEAAKKTEGKPCPVCGLQIDKLEMPLGNGNGHKVTDGLPDFDEQADAEFEKMGQERDEMEAAAVGSSVEKPKRRSHKD